jgi:antitoxin (DNA-binding transcriptional repressor) of toxin-antitoxin stability system
MPVQVNIYEAKSKFSKLINQAIAGEEIREYKVSTVW